MTSKTKKMTFFETLLKDSSTDLMSLNEALILVRNKDFDHKINGLFIDGVIKRFEILFTKVINLLRFALIEEGVETISPRQAVQEAVRLDWIKDTELWLVALDARTSTLSRTNDISHNEYINIISDFATETEVITNLLSELRKRI